MLEKKHRKRDTWYEQEAREKRSEGKWHLGQR